LGILRFEGLDATYDLANEGYSVLLGFDDDAQPTQNPFLYQSGDVRLPNPLFSLWADVYIEPKRIMGTVTLRIPRNRKSWNNSNIYTLETYDFFQKWARKIQKKSSWEIERRNMDVHFSDKEGRTLFALTLSEGLPQIDFHFGHQGCIEQRAEDVSEFTRHMSRNEFALNEIIDVLSPNYRKTRYVSFKPAE